jgi:iron complex outermembrane receptor protein
MAYGVSKGLFGLKIGAAALLASTCLSGVTASLAQATTPETGGPGAPADDPAPAAPVVSPTPVTQVPPNAGGDETAQQGIGDITVTARRRAERLQDIPMAIDAFAGKALENMGIATVDDALAHSTNFDMRHDEQPGVFTSSVRGVSQNRNGEAPVAYVVDGVTAASAAQITQQLFDVERVELLKGPQGAIYGRNAIGGAINIVTKAPTNGYEAEVKAEYGKNDDLQLSGNLSGPIVSDKILARVSGYYNRTDGLLYNVTTQKRPDFSRDYGGRARLIFLLSDALKFDLRSSYSNIRSGGAYYYNTDNSFHNNPVGVIQGDQMGTAHRRIWDVSGKFDLETPIGTVTATSTYMNLRQGLDHQELDWTPIPYYKASAGDTNKSFTQEIRVTSPSKQRFRYVFGGFYQHTKRFRFTDVLFNPVYDATGDADPAHAQFVDVAYAPQNQKQITKSLFGQINYDLLPKLELTLAGRYDVDDRTDIQPSLGVRKRRDSKFQPKASLAYHIGDDSLIYATYAVGYRPGSFNPPNNIQSDVKSESLTSYEVGAKTSLFDHAVRLNANVYYNDFSHQQFFLLAQPSGGGGVVQLILNGQKSRIWGIEADANINPIRDLLLTASIGTTKGTIRKFDLPTLAGGASQFEGKYLPNTARYTLLLSGQYTPRITDDLNLLLRADFKRYGRTYWGFDNIYNQSPYNLVDLRAGVSGKAWSLSVFGENVFNKKYAVEGFDKRFSGFVTNIAWPSRPAFYGVEVGYRFR